MLNAAILTISLLTPLGATMNIGTFEFSSMEMCLSALEVAESKFSTESGSILQQYPMMIGSEVDIVCEPKKYQEQKVKEGQYEA